MKLHLNIFPCLVPDFKWDVFSTSPLRIIFVFSFGRYFFFQVKEFSFNS